MLKAEEMWILRCSGSLDEKLAFKILSSCQTKPGVGRSSGATESFYSHRRSRIVMLCATESMDCKSAKPGPGVGRIREPSEGADLSAGPFHPSTRPGLLLALV